MGKEISTLGGAIATVTTSVAAGVTFGQVKTLNDAVESCAKYTGKSFMDTSVRHLGEATGKGVATAATAVAAGVTFGQVDSLNEAVVTCAKSTAKSTAEAQKAMVSTLNDAVDGVPVVGHFKGVIHYAFGDKSGGEKAMKSASRTVGVIAGGAGGFVVGGPMGAAAGGITGGVAADAIISGADSAVHGEWRPYGQIAAWNSVANAHTDDEIIDGVIGSLVTPAFDAFTGFEAGKRFASRANGKARPRGTIKRPSTVKLPGQSVAGEHNLKGLGGSAVNSNNALNAFMEQETKLQPKHYPPPPPSRVSVASENIPTAKGKAIPSTASTMRSSVQSVAGKQNLEGLGGDVQPIPRNSNNALNVFMEKESKPRPKQFQPPAPRIRVTVASENIRSTNGKARPSTTNTNASTVRSPLQSVAGKQNLEGLGGNVEPIPRNSNNALKILTEQESQPQPKQLQPPAPPNRVRIASENIPSANGKARRSTPSTSSSTVRSSVQSVAGEQNLEGLCENVEPIPRNSNNAFDVFIEQEFKPQPKQLQPLALRSRVRVASENIPSANGKARPSTMKLSVQSVNISCESFDWNM